MIAVLGVFLFYFLLFALVSFLYPEIRKQNYDQAKKAYAKDCKEFDNITKLNDEKKPVYKIVQEEAIKHSINKNAKKYDDVINDGSDDDEPIKEYKGFFRRLSNKDLK